MYDLRFGDCLDVMQTMPAASVDMICADLPYGTTESKWDVVIPFEALWHEYKRVTKASAAIVLTASQPFTSALIASNFKDFKYCWVWDKSRPSNPQLAKIQPLKTHEDIAVFSRGKVPYFPQGVCEIPEEKRKVKFPGQRNLLMLRTQKPYVQTHTNYPKAILKFGIERGLHPTQKPVALMEYLIATYTAPGAVVLDNCAGSGTAGVAALRIGRRFIGIENDPKYYAIAERRLAAEAALLAA